jgi:hypothetical protein
MAPNDPSREVSVEIQENPWRATRGFSIFSISDDLAILCGRVVRIG